LCNVRHELEERLCRWLLLASDRLDEKAIPRLPGWNCRATENNPRSELIEPAGGEPLHRLNLPPMEIGRLHGGDTCSNPPQRKMTFLLRLQFRTARFLLNRSFAQRSCVVARGVHPTTRRRTARSWRWPARLSSHRSISFRHWRRQFSTSPSVILPASVC